MAAATTDRAPHEQKCNAEETQIKDFALKTSRSFEPVVDDPQGNPSGAGDCNRQGGEHNNQTLERESAHKMCTDLANLELKPHVEQEDCNVEDPEQKSV